MSIKLVPLRQNKICKIVLFPLKKFKSDFSQPLHSFDYISELHIVQILSFSKSFPLKQVFKCPKKEN